MKTTTNHIEELYDEDELDAFASDAEVLVREISSRNKAFQKSLTEQVVKKSFNTIGKGLEHACEYHRKNPYQCLAVAGIFGLCLGLWINRSGEDS